MTGVRLILLIAVLSKLGRINDGGSDSTRADVVVVFLSKRSLLMLAFIIEVAVLTLLLFSAGRILNCTVIAGIGGVFCAYHLASYLLGKNGCACFTGYQEAFTFVRQLNRISWVLSAFMLCGGCFIARRLSAENSGKN